MNTKEKATKRKEPPGNLPFYFRPSDLETIGISRDKLQTWLRCGSAEYVSYGLYRITSAPVSEYETIAMVCSRVRGAVVCLLTALQVHGIGTQSPREIWIAIDHKARKPVLDQFPVRLLIYSKKMMTSGIEVFDIQGVETRITSPARKVVDFFRFRSKVGLDVAIEVLKDVLAVKMTTPAEIMRIGNRCRATTTIRPYIEMITL